MKNSALKEKLGEIATLPFRMILLLMLVLPLCLIRPLGLLASVATGIFWVTKNREALGGKFHRIRHYASVRLRLDSRNSFWFENEGKDKILVLISKLSAEGKSYCDLTKELPLPCRSHWFAISEGLSELGILSQYTGDSFYIVWKPLEPVQNH